MKLEQALALLDPSVDDHWTSDGLPRMDVLVELTDDAKLSRRVVTDAAPGLTRHAMLEEAGDVPAETEDAPTDAPEPSAPDAPDSPQEAPEAPHEDPVTAPGAPTAPDPTAPCPPGKRGPLIMEVHDTVLSMPIAKVMGDSDLTDRALAEVGRQIVVHMETRDEIAKELDQLYAKAEILKRQAVQHDRRKPKTNHGIRAYLEAQRKTREERAKRALAFVDANTTAKDVADVLRRGSKLDSAMSQRKPARGAARPSVRPLLAAK